jgi:hypothetical protein
MSSRCSAAFHIRAAVLTLLLVCSSGSSAAQIPNPPEQPPDISILEYSYTTKYRLESREEYRTHIEQYNADAHGERKIWVGQVPIYHYRALIKNTGTKEIRSIDWTYVFVFDTGAPLPTELSRNFTCKRTIRPGESTEIDQGKAPASGPGTVSVEKDGKSVFLQPAREYARIRRIEYADGSVWEAKKRPRTH